MGHLVELLPMPGELVHLVDFLLASRSELGHLVELLPVHGKLVPPVDFLLASRSELGHPVELLPVHGKLATGRTAAGSKGGILSR